MTAPDTQKIFRSFLVEAGKYALKHQTGVATHYKDGEQAVTDTDLYISGLAHSCFKDLVEKEGFLLIDEESIGDVGAPDAVFESADDLLILDPIDGTAGYAVGRGYWGVMLAHWHKGKPVWGGIYLPVQQTFIVTHEDGVARYSGRGGEEARTVLTAKPMVINSQTYVEIHRTNHLAADRDLLKRKAWFNTPESAVQSAFSVLQGHSAAAVIPSNFCIWDFAATVTLAQKAGFSVFDLRTGEEKETFTAADFQNNWRSKTKFVVCHPDNKTIMTQLLAEDL